MLPSRMTLTERLRARFTGRIPETLHPGRGLAMVDVVYTWRCRRACWRAARSLQQELAADCKKRGITVELVQVDVRPVCCCLGNRVFVEYELRSPQALAGVADIIS